MQRSIAVPRKRSLFRSVRWHIAASTRSSRFNSDNDPNGHESPNQVSDDTPPRTTGSIIRLTPTKKTTAPKLQETRYYVILLRATSRPQSNPPSQSSAPTALLRSLPQMVTVSDSTGQLAQTTYYYDEVR